MVCTFRLFSLRASRSRSGKVVLVVLVLVFVHVHVHVHVLVLDLVLETLNKNVLFSPYEVRSKSNENPSVTFLFFNQNCIAIPI